MSEPQFFPMEFSSDLAGKMMVGIVVWNGYRWESVMERVRSVGEK